MPNKNMQLDELDKKVLSEIPLLIDILTTTLNRLSGILENHFEIIEKETEAFINNNTEWKVSTKDSYKNYHYPFWEVYDKRISITNLYEYYRIDYAMYAYKGDYNNPLNGFEIWIGFEYSKEKDLNPYLFYNLQRESVNKLDGINIPYDIFKLFQKINDTVEVSHPSEGGKSETVRFYNYDITDNDKIEEQFKIFRTKILGQYLKNTKW